MFSFVHITSVSDSVVSANEVNEPIFYANFEINLGGFGNRGTASVSRCDEIVREEYEGNHSMKISGRGSDNWHGAQVNITHLIYPGGEYIFEAYVFGHVSAEYVMSLHVMGDGVNPETGEDSHFPWIGNAVIEGEWTRLTGTFTAPENIDTIFLNFETNADVRPDIYVDFVSIYAVGDTPVKEFHGGFDSTTPSLREVWADYFEMGNIYTPCTSFDSRYDLLLKHFDLLTAENIMKPRYFQPAPGVFAWDLPDAMVDFAEENDLEVIGHTLIWHSQSFEWIDEANTTRDEAIEIMRNHIQTVVGRYAERNPGVIVAWDVVNEAIVPRQGQDPSDWRNHLRDTKWLRLIGPDYIALAFEFAREVDPNAILYYNDYNLNVELKARAVYYMVKELREEGVPIDRIGMQGHYQVTTPIESVRNSLELFSGIDGIEVSFTEVDVTIPEAGQSTELSLDHEILQGQFYAQLFQIFREFHEIIPRVTFWGMDDGNSWRSDLFPTLFNEDLSPKLAFWAVVDPDGFLREHPLYEHPEPQTARATFGTPIMGDFEDDIWSTADFIWVVNQMTAHNGATAKARVLWDVDNIYVLMNVRKPAELNACPNAPAHEQDSVEVFLSQNNNRSPFFQEGDYQLRVSFENKHSYGSTGTIDGFVSYIEEMEIGYQVMMKIPLESEAYVGRILGFDLQVNDARDGSRMSFAKWNDPTDMSWQSTELWGNLQLDGDIEEVEASIEEVESNNMTSAIVLGVVLVSVVVGVCAYPRLKNHKKIDKD